MEAIGESARFVAEPSASLLPLRGLLEELRKEIKQLCVVSSGTQVTIIKVSSKIILA